MTATVPWFFHPRTGAWRRATGRIVALHESGRVTITHTCEGRVYRVTGWPIMARAA